MNRVAVLGNCQAEGLIPCLRFYQPGLKIVPFIHPECRKSWPDNVALMAELEKYDVVVSVDPIAGLYGKIDERIQAGAWSSVVRCPPIYFTAFHPDLIYADRSDTGGRVHSPLGDYNSALALLAYQQGFTVDEAVRLFDAAVYRAAGYFDSWLSSEQRLLHAGIYYDFPMEKLYRSWLRRGVFMHSINHPKLFVFADLAAEILHLRGMEADSRLAESYLPDDLINNSVWPVYPEIGRQMSLHGCYIFKAGPRFYNLREFVEGSYQLYRGVPPRVMRSVRLDTWRQDAAFMELIESRRGACNRIGL